MLNDNQIIESLENGSVKIFYYFYRENNTIKHYDKEVSFMDTDKFRDYLYSDRLKVTLGRIVKTLGKQKIKKKNRFKDYPDCYDLSTSSDRYLLRPGESIVILTNERIALDGNHSVLIIPRVSLSEVGIIVTPAYIDPYYNGLLRLNVTNNSDSSYELKMLETIAQCFFFNFPDDVNITYQTQFSQKSVFVGQNWLSILNEDRPPFPVKKNRKYINPVYESLRNTCRYIFEFINNNALVTAVISIIIIGITGYLSFNDYKVNTERILSNYETSSTEIIIDAGEKSGKREVEIPYEKDKIITIMFNHDNISYEIFSGPKQGTSMVIFYYELEKPQSNKFELDFTYTVVKKV